MSFDQNDESTKSKMLDILTRVQQTSTENSNELEQTPQREDLDSDDDECSNLVTRLAGVDLDDAGKVWDCLTSDERQEFEAFLRLVLQVEYHTVKLIKIGIY